MEGTGKIIHVVATHLPVPSSPGGKEHLQCPEVRFLSATRRTHSFAYTLLLRQLPPPFITIDADYLNMDLLALLISD